MTDAAARPPRDASLSTWTRLLAVGGGAVLLLQALAAVLLTDLEAALIAVGVALSLALLRYRRGLLGKIGLALLSADIAFWMVPAAVSNGTQGDGPGATVLPAALAASAAVTLVAALAALLRGRPPVPIGYGVAAVALAAFAAASIGSMIGGGGVAPRPGDLVVDMKDVRFADEHLEAAAGEVSVAVSNADLFWHTFTIRELDVDVRVPVNADRRSTFDARAGTYEFVCAIPGHAQAGMKGTLRVR